MPWLLGFLEDRSRRFDGLFKLRSWFGTGGTLIVLSKEDPRFFSISGVIVKIILWSDGSLFFYIYIASQLTLPKFNSFESNEHNDELFTNSEYEPDAIKDENELRQHVYEFNEEENEDTRLSEKEKIEHSDYKDYEK